MGPDIQATVRSIMAQAPGKVAVACHHLVTGERWSLNDQPMPAASLIKVHLAIAAYQAAERGELPLGEKLTVAALADDDEAEFDNVGHAPPGVRHSWRKLIDRMLTESDNAATNTVIDRLGLDAVAPIAARLGLAHTALRRRMLDVAARRAGLENTLTAGEMVRVLVALARGELLNPAHTAELLALLRHVRDDEKLAAGLSADVTLAHKTGELPGLRHDAGLVSDPDGSHAWAVAVLAEGEAEADRVIAAIGQALQAHFTARRELYAEAAAALEQTRRRLIPDPRLAYDTLELAWDAGEPVLKGVTTVPARLASAPAVRSEAAPAGDRPAVVHVPCLQLRGGPGHARELVSQLRLGDRVAVLEAGPDWHVLLGPDGYVARGKANNVRPDDGWSPTHLVSHPLVTCTASDGRVFQLSAGSRLIWADGAFTLPDGATGALAAELVRPLGAIGTVEALLTLARRFLGLPYLWGGTTGWGIDCSGLVQLTYAVMGVALPRDADQQQAATRAVAERDRLEPGDLVFFPGHVGIYLGAGEFIHASAQAGMVTINSFDRGASHYDDWLFENFSGGGASPLRVAAATA